MVRKERVRERGGSIECKRPAEVIWHVHTVPSALNDSLTLAMAKPEFA